MVDFTGSWRADLQRSNFVGPVPDALVIRIEHSGPHLLEDLAITRSDGAGQRVVFQCTVDGKQTAGLLNGREIPTRATWEGAELIVESWVTLGPRECYFRDCWSLSPDGQVLTMEHRSDDLAGQVTVLDRIA